MNFFGWSYPPGAANDLRAPWNQGEPPCEVCGKDIDDCICSECPKCGEYGNPDCYEHHGLVRTEEQIASMAEIEARKKADDEAICRMERTYATEPVEQ